MSESNHELQLKGFWIRPHSYITYLEEGDITLEFKNVSDESIEIDKIACSFETDIGLSPTESILSPMISIKPNNISRVRVTFLIDLKMKLGTNFAKIDVTYRNAKSQKSTTVTFTNPYTRCIIINPIHPPEKHFFISYKGSNDRQLATKLDRHLTKIGFKGYVAENDNRPGIDIWQEKIFPAIDDCVALIVLWTSDSLTDPSTIFREVTYAKEKQKRVILLAEHGLKIPEIFLGDKEYVQIQSKITDDDLIDLVENIEKTYKGGGFET